MKINIRKILLFAILFLGIIFCNSIVNAASFSASASKTTIQKGKTATITITANGCGGKFSISSSDSSVASISSSSEWIESGSKSIIVTAKKEGKATITIKAYDVADSSTSQAVTGSKSISIAVKDTTSNSNNGNNGNNNSNNNNNNNTTPPTDPTPTFTSVNEIVYAKSTANVRSSYSTSSSIIGSLKTGDSITRTGVSSNGWSKITYNGKTAYVSSNLITKTKPEEPKEPENEKPDEKEQNNLKLYSLKIENYNLKPEFSKDVYQYELNVENDVEKLEIEAISDDKDVVIEVSGNENLKVGENNITITITKDKSEEKAVYTIKAIKEDKQQEQTEETIVKINQDGLNEEIDKVNTNLKIRTWTIRGIIIFVTILIIIMIILRYFTTREDDYEQDYDNEYVNIKQKFNELNNLMDEEQQEEKVDIEEQNEDEQENTDERAADNDNNLEYKIRRNKKPRGKHF